MHGRVQAGQTVITQLRALKKHWFAPVRDAAKAAIGGWKDQVANAPAGPVTAGGGGGLTTTARSGIPTRPPSLAARLWSEV